MVLLTVTPAIAEALERWRTLGPDEALDRTEGEPLLDDADAGKPISHGQILDLRNKLKSKGCDDFPLERLLVGSRVYIPPPPPKPEPSDEYKALMARLRRDEEARAYERMINPPTPAETYAQRFPTARSYAAVNRPDRAADLGDDADDVTFNDVHRQLMLILNFVVSILGVAGTLWVVARWWSTPARLLLTMGGSAVVGIAEVGVYYFYVWHLTDASRKDKKFKERKEVVQTWVVEGEPDVAGEAMQSSESVVEALRSTQASGRDFDDSQVIRRQKAR